MLSLKSGSISFKNKFVAIVTSFTFWLKFFAYAIPLALLLYVLYWNLLPGNYSQTFTIQVGSATDTSGQFHLEPSRDLSDRKIATDGTTYRELNGLALAFFEPKSLPKNSKIKISVDGENVSLIPLQMNFNPDSVQWENSWDFTQNKQPYQLGLIGNAFPFDQCVYFNGNDSIGLPYSQNRFENGQLSIYAEWQPENSTDDFQEIVGHYNWEILQNRTSVEFQIGRVNNAEGQFYSLKYPINKDFFSKKHSLLAIYKPSTNNGYIQLYIDGSYAGTEWLGSDFIWAPYNETRNLTWGKSDHGVATHFQGCIYNVSLTNTDVLIPVKEITIDYAANLLNNIPITGLLGNIKSINLKVN